MAIRPQRKNANRHTPRGMGLLEGSIEQDGWIGAITTAADGETFDGSARVEVTARMEMLDDPIWRCCAVLLRTRHATASPGRVVCSSPGEAATCALRFGAERA